MFQKFKNSELNSAFRNVIDKCILEASFAPKDA